MIRLDPDISKMMNEEGMTSDDLINLRNDKGTQFMINNRNLTNTLNKISFLLTPHLLGLEKWFKLKRLQNQKKRKKNVERKIIMAAGKYNFTKISSNLLKVDDSEKNVFKAFYGY